MGTAAILALLASLALGLVAPKDALSGFGDPAVIAVAAVLIVGYSYGFFNGRDLFRMGLSVTIVQGLVLLVLVPFYWPWIGLR